MSDLKSCPFCGSTNLNSGGDDKIVGVWCLDCEATGPNHYGRSEWNTRPNLVPRAEADAMVAAAYEAAEMCADGLSDLWHSQYKDRTSPHAGSSYKEGMSDGAVDVAAALSKLTPADARAALDKRLAEAKLEGFNAAADHIREMYPAEWQQLGPSGQRALSGLKKNMINAMRRGDNE